MNTHIFGQKAFWTVLATVTLLAITTNAAETRYKDRLFEVSKEVDVTYAEKVPKLSSLHDIAKLTFSFGDSIFFYTSESEVTLSSMKMDIYTPKGDTEKKRAAVIVAHGGAMIKGSKNDFSQLSITYCDSLAARGFVTASMGYRTGVSLRGEGNSLSIDSADFGRSVYRGVQDINAAVRYMRKNADKYGIDTNRIYLIGNSSGAILSIENIYTNNESEFPSYINYGDAPDLGPLNLYGEQGVGFHANGGVFLWGATHDPSIIGSSEVPVLLIHGTEDKTVPFKVGHPLDGAARMLKRMAPEEYAPLVEAIDFVVETPTLYGSYVIDSILKAKNIEHETFFANTSTHEVYDELEYEKTVQTKVFDFLFKLASSNSTTSIGKHTIASRASGIQMQKGNLSFIVTRGNNLKYTVMDLRGRPAMSGRVSANESVNLSSLSNGVYVLHVQGERAIRIGISK